MAACRFGMQNYLKKPQNTVWGHVKCFQLNVDIF